jgi:hypothetical protein
MKFRLLLLIAFLITSAQDAPSISITSPTAGEAVAGKVTISGTTDFPGFTSSQLDFSYASNPTDTWFALQTSTQPVNKSAIFDWDTTLITDGEYILRLRVLVSDGTVQEVTVPVKVQNDSPLPTPTPMATETSTPIIVEVPPTPFLIATLPPATKTPRPDPTPLPENKVSLSQNSIYASLARGALVVLGFFLMAGIILRNRRY